MGTPWFLCSPVLCSSNHCSLVMATFNSSASLPTLLRVNGSGDSALSTDGAAMPVQFLVLRIMVALAYRLVGIIGLLGNLAVLWVLGNYGQCVPGPPSDTFVFSLALADLGLALTLPFWQPSQQWTSTGLSEVPSAR